MTFWVAGAVVGSALIGANAANKAASTQAEAANRSGDLQYQQWKESTALLEPWRQAGVNALSKLEKAVDYTPFGMDQFKADPGYAFRLSEGQKALDRSAAARGGLISGGALKAATRYGQDMGSQEYQNAFNRYQTERSAMLNPLQSLAGVGQSTAQQIGTSGQQMASNVGESYQNAANARASGYVGTSNALTGALGTGLNYYQGQNYLNMLRPSGGGSVSGAWNPTTGTFGP